MLGKIFRVYILLGDIKMSPAFILIGKRISSK